MGGSFGSKNRVRVGGEFDDQISSKLDKLRDKFDTLGKNKGAQSILMGVGLGAGAMAVGAVAAVVEKLGEVAFAAIDDASNLAETVSKANVIFGDGADEIEAWADTAADAFGQSKRQALDTAAGFAGLFDTVGLSLDQSADYAKDLTELGSDLASFFNTDVDSALQALKSGLSGEAEPLKRFNVFLSETAVSAKLAEMGIKKTGGSFTEAQKATARYALIMEQTGAAQGDFARTSDGLANSQRSIAAQMEDLSAEIGEALLPVMLDLANFANDTLIPALSDTVKWFKENEQGIAFMGDVFTFVAQGPMVLASSKFREFQEQTGSASEATGELTDSVKSMAQGVTRDVGSARASIRTFGTAAWGTRNKFWDSMDDIVEKFRTTSADLEADVNATIDAIYDPMRRQMELTAVTAEIASQKRIIADRESTKEEVAGAKARIKELRIQQEQITTLQVVLGEAVDVNGTKMRKYVADWAKAGPEARLEINRTIMRLEYLGRLAEEPIYANFSFTGLTGATQQRRAHGGPVAAGEPYIVGEEGPELYVPERSGSIVPNDRLTGGSGGGWSGAPVEIPIVLDGREIARVVDRHLSYRTSAQPR